ncbi:prephenate dehydratase [Anaeromyxobacter paludicola]|uniref:Prephenate dehydratase n=1 Tax=Anaeromyxobacter paludicola TaxID=2918171 RepID=A0ABN6N6Q2_9BACT|nr:prephenate dehydratase [Anaeromyxobacter paludicola]BDG07694.1 chorismate mutase [Anaeromyxobacter paludicola]
MRVAYLGPPGTFSEEAVGRCDLARGGEHVPYPSIPDAYEAVAKGEVDAALLPIENSIEGSVNATLDLLVHRPGLRIRREVLLPIEQQLMAARGTRLEDVKKVLSHPQPLGQCAGFLRERLRGVPLEATASTAEAARLVAAQGEGAALAALGPRAAALRYGLEILAEDVQDAEANTTRFVLVAREDEAPTGRDKTSIAFTLDRDRPGGLYEVMGELARRQINLSRIESRPMKQALGHYVFYLDFEGHRADPACAEALMGALQRVHALHLLGSYPRAQG